MSNRALIAALKDHGHTVVVDEPRGLVWAATTVARPDGSRGVIWEEVSQMTPAQLREWLGY